MAFEGVDKLVKLLEPEIEWLKQLDSTPKEPTISAKDKIAIRGSLAERLADTPHEADVNKRTDDIRLGQAQLNPDDNEVIDKMINDMMDHILGGRS